MRPFFPFARAHQKISIKMHSIESRFPVGPSNILFAAGVHVCTFQLGNFIGSEVVKCKKDADGFCASGPDMLFLHPSLITSFCTDRRFGRMVDEDLTSLMRSDPSVLNALAPA